MNEESRPNPRLFDEVIGQESAVAAMESAARNPVHAYLFNGALGATRVAARAFAAALLCPEGGCGHCRHCERALAGAHPDLVTVERTGASLSVDDARRLVGLAQRRPLESARQVLVVPEVNLAVRTVPALLKTIEEPPPSTAFILLAEVLPRELETIVSRCVLVRFSPVPRSAVTQWLAARGVDQDRAEAIAENAGGDLDRARLLAEDPQYTERIALWRSIPSRLDGHGAPADVLVKALLAAADESIEPLRSRHEAEMQALAEEAEAWGEKGVSGRKEIVERQNREERRFRTDEIRSGLGVLARAYRERLAESLGQSVPSASTDIARSDAAVTLISETAESMQYNPNEILLLQGLLVRLGNLA